MRRQTLTLELIEHDDGTPDTFTAACSGFGDNVDASDLTIFQVKAIAYQLVASRANPILINDEEIEDMADTLWELLVQTLKSTVEHAAMTTGPNTVKA